MGVEPFEKLELFGVNENTIKALMNSDWPQYKSLETTVTFDGGTAHAIGDHDGTGDPHTLFTITGTVEMTIIAVCETSLTGTSATVEVGTALSTGGLIALTVGTTIVANEIWHDANCDASVEATSVAGRYIVNQDVILTCKTANVTAGALRFIVRWAPISADGKVEVA